MGIGLSGFQEKLRGCFPITLLLVGFSQGEVGWSKRGITLDHAAVFPTRRLKILRRFFRLP